MPIGRLAHDHFDHCGIAQLAAGGERIGHVIVEAILRVEHAGDAPLGVAAIGLSQAALGDDDDRKYRIDRLPPASRPARRR